MYNSLDKAGTYEVLVYSDRAQFLVTPTRVRLPLSPSVPHESIIAFVDEAHENGDDDKGGERKGLKRKFVSFSSSPGCNDLENARGRSVTVVLDDDTKAEGELISTNRPSQGDIVIWDADQERLQVYKKFKAVHLNSEQPKNSILLKVHPDRLQDTRVSFIDAGICWQPSYAVFVEGDRILCLKANASIRNTTKQWFAPKRLTVVAGGGPTKKEIRTQRSLVLECAVFEGPTERPDRQDFAEYERYVHEEPDPIPPEHSIAPLFTADFEVQKRIYVCSLEDCSHFAAANPVVRWGFRVEAPRYLPHGTVAAHDTSDSARSLGKGTIPATAAGKEFDILFGPTNHLSISVEISVSTTKEPFPHELLVKTVTTTTYTITTINNTEKDASVLLQLSRPRDPIDVVYHPQIESLAPTGLLEWVVVAPPGRNQVVHTIRVADVAKAK